MASALSEQLAQPGEATSPRHIDQLDFMERLGLLVDREEVVRHNVRLKSRLRQTACMEDLDYRTGRCRDRRLMLALARCDWVRRHQNVVITGPTGVGKSYVACALAHKACLEGFSVRYYRLPRLLEDLAIAHGDGRYLKLLQQIARVHVLVLDGWGLTQLTTSQQQHLLELLDDRHRRSSTVATSQLPVGHWHGAMDNPTLADAILDRLIHNAHRIELTGDSMRKSMSELQSHSHQIDHSSR